MAVKKEQLIEEAQTLSLDVGESNTVAEIKKAIEGAKKEDKEKQSDKDVESEQTPEEVLKAKKDAAKVAKKAGPKHTRAMAEAESSEKPDTKEESKPKKVVKPARPRIERRGKKYREAYKHLDKSKDYELAEAIELLNKTSFVKFIPSVEIHVNLGVDPKQADQMVRSTTVLPHGNGKSQRVAVLGSDEDQKLAKAAGADVVGEDNLLDDITKGKTDFDVLVATPEVMPKLGKHAKQLGPKGLMPNPKSGTVTNDVAKAVKELKGGRIEFRIDASGIIHQVVGKLDFKPTQITENIKAFLKAVAAAKPDSVKGIYIKRVTLTSSMGPGIKLNISSALE